jgi:hypothetical protein
MASPTVYSTGTATVTEGEVSVAGQGTAWAISLVTGGMFSLRGYSVPIEEVVSDSEITLAYAWPVESYVESPYAISRETSEGTRAVWTNDRLATIIAKLALVGIHPQYSGPLEDRDAISPAPETGEYFLRAEPGFDLEIYRKTDSGWDGPFYLRGAAGDDGSDGIQSSNATVTNIIKITQAAYDALSPIDSTTLYIIVG